MFDNRVFVRIKNLIAKGSCSDIYEIEACQDDSNSKDIFETLVSNNQNISKLVAKVSNNLGLIEIEVLKMARSRNTDFITRIEGHSVCMLNKSLILMPRAIRDLQRIEKPISESTERALITFFSSVLEFFESINTVYCDWKPGNILDYGNNNFKLTDFGSCLENRVRVNHPNNINLVFCSPYLMNLYENMQITPKFRDDKIGVVYVFMWLKGINLPWSSFNPLADLIDYTKVTRHIYSSKVDESIHRFRFETMDIPDDFKSTLSSIYHDFKLCD